MWMFSEKWGWFEHFINEQGNWVVVEQTYIFWNIGVWIEITTWNWMFLGVEQFERCTISWRMNIFLELNNLKDVRFLGEWIFLEFVFTSSTLGPLWCCPVCSLSIATLIKPEHVWHLAIR